MEPKSELTDPARDRRILWVEGYRDNREFLAVFLGMAGYAVTSCDSVSQAAIMLEDRQFDIYIVGDCLPFGSSLPLAAQINTVNPKAPLILYSALAFSRDIEQGLNAGAQAYITKPGNLDYLLATIKSLLRRNHRRRRSVPGGKAKRRGRQPASDQPSTAAEISRETEVLSESSHHRSKIPLTGPMGKLGLYGSATG
jgi:DNA-binding response OmpR family regulator